MASCGESCGWAAAVCAMFLSGSFGVPIKSETARRLDIDPMVFQTYKTVVCFLVSATSLWLLDHPFRFTPWGIVSGLFWIPGGVGTVASIKLAGLAIAVAVGNSCIALVSFTWGIFVFREAIHSKLMACLGVCMMIFGFSGMSYFSTRSSGGVSTSKNQEEEQQQQITKSELEIPRRQLLTPTNSGCSKVSLSPDSTPNSGNTMDLIDEEARIEMSTTTKTNSTEESLKSSQHHQADHLHSHYSGADDEDDNENDKSNHAGKHGNPESNGETQKAETSSNAGGAGLRHRQAHHVQHHANESTPTPYLHHNKSLPASSPIIPMTHRPYQELEEVHSFITWVPQSATPNPTDVLLHVGGGDDHYPWKITRRQAGIALAVCNGCWGGSVMVPMKFCPDKAITNGIGYVWSFSIGALVVNAGLWIFRFLWLLVDTKSVPEAYRALPSFHIQQMWQPGGLSGLLWSVGNLFSILSVDYLGEGVGYCVVQASMLVSGLWGILYFHEVQGRSLIAKWFGSAMVTIAGILVLSYEHHAT